jgi:hypothetical protein
MDGQWLSPRIVRAACVAAFSAAAPVATGCWASNPCEPGQTLRLDYCFPGAPSGDGAAGGEAGTDGTAPSEGGVLAEGGEGGGGATATFGTSCASQSDCAGGDAPVCAAPQLPYCTQINCQPGEANAGACPSGWQCFTVPPNPSVCLQE